MEAGPETKSRVEPVKVTRAVTHIGLGEANEGKLAALNKLAEEFLRVCQLYVERFCSLEEPDAYREPIEQTELSERWHRVAIQQAAGVAKSWRTNRKRLHEQYLERVRSYEYHEKRGTLWKGRKRPEWKEPRIPQLSAMVIRANANVVAEVHEERVARLEAAEGTTYDFWLRISTLEPGKPMFVPVRLSAYHRSAIGELARNTSVELARRDGKWWLTVTVSDTVEPTTSEVSVAVGADVGIKTLVRGSDGTEYGTFDGKLAKRHKKDRQKRQRKAKLRACLEKKGVKKLPSVEDKRLGRHVRQEINRAVNEFLADHAGMILVIEILSVASMRFRAKAMNAYLYASNLGHILKQMKWKAMLCGQEVIEVASAYTSQECRICHYTAPGNRPKQETFSCEVCGNRGNADVEAALTILSRRGDQEIAEAGSRDEIKAILDRRHAEWLDQTGFRSESARLVARSPGIGGQQA
jgi:IS605 OrfB family transposase